MKNFFKRCIFTVGLPFFLVLGLIMSVLIFMFDRHSFIRINGFWRTTFEALAGVLDDYFDSMKNPSDWKMF